MMLRTLSSVLKPATANKWRQSSCKQISSSTKVAKANSSTVEPLVQTEWLAKNLQNVKILDASWYLPMHQRNPDQEFIQKRLPNALRFNINSLKETSTPFPHFLPTTKTFETYVENLGIKEDDHIVLYDTNGWTAQRSWWTFKIFGHANVSVLDGGICKWMSKGLNIESNVPHANPKSSNYRSNMRTEMLRNTDQIKTNISEKKFQVLDARPKPKFLGAEPEANPQIRPGHIPCSLNLPMDELLKSHHDGQFKTYHKDEILRQKFMAAGIDVEKPVITTCGTGVTACVLYFALHKLNPSADLSLYNGSWVEWGARSDTPVEK